MRIAPSLLLVSAALPSDALAQRPLYDRAPGPPVTIGRGSGELLLADLDRDGHLDLVAKHLVERRIGVHRGDGSGGFAANAFLLRLPFEPGALTAADVDGDGALDLGIAGRDSTGEYVQLYRGRPDATFETVSAFRLRIGDPAETWKPTLRFVDLNGDARLDLVVSNGRRRRIDVLLAGGGTFEPPRRLSLPGPMDRHFFEIADVDGDDRMDLVVVSGTEDGAAGSLLIWRGDGRGGFARSGHRIAVPAQPRIATVADLTGDGRPDIVLGQAGPRLTILTNDGAGTFGTAREVRLASPAFHAIVARVNGDARADLVVACGSGVAVLVGTAGGLAPAAGSPYSANAGAYQLTTGDLNEDGKVDIIASSFESPAVTVLLAR